MNCVKLNEVLKGKVIKEIRGEFGDIRIEFEDETIFRLEIESYEDEKSIRYSVFKYEGKAIDLFDEKVSKRRVTSERWI